MKEYTTDKIRNVALLGHSGSGKSTLSEAMLYHYGHIDRMGKTEDGNLTADYDPEEIKRNTSINTSLLPVETKEGVKINLLDCPGNSDFIGEIKSALHVAEGALIFVDASSGVQVGTEKAVEYAEAAKLHVVMFVNKLDKDNTDFAKTIQQITDAFGKKAVPLTIPIGSQSGLSGIIDLLRMKAVDETGGKTTLSDVPADLLEEVKSAHEQIVEAAAEGEEALMEKYFEEGDLTPEEVDRGLKAAFMEGSFIPVLCGSALKGIGSEPVENFLQHSFPSPLEGKGIEVQKGEETETQAFDSSAPFSAFVFKTVSDDFAGRLTFFKVVGGSMAPGTPLHNITQDKSEKVAHVLSVRGKKQIEVARINAGDIGVVAKLTHTFTNDTLSESKGTDLYLPTKFPQRTSTIALQAHNSKDEDKIGGGLHTLLEQDPTLYVERDAEVHQTLLSGMGEQHLDVAIERLRAKSKVEVDILKQKIRYREAITKLADGSYRHKKQSGGRGQFAEVYIKLSPLNEEGEDYKFTWSVFGGSIPTNFQSAVDKGAQMALEKGILAGYRVVNMHVDCYDGKHHDVDSSDMAFQIATQQAFKQIAQDAGPIILEPIANVTTTVPDQYMGDVMGDVSQRRGRIQGTENLGNKVVVNSLMPEGEMFTYSQNLRSITGGRGTFEKTFSHYDPVPRDVQQKIIDEAKKAHEEEA